MGMQVIGILFIVASLSLQLWARLHLGRFYAERAEFQPGHRLISTGPYAYMRHPLFTSYFLFGIGLFLIAPSVLTLSICIYIFWNFSKAAIKDEKVMAENMPEYKAYMQRTPRFFPFGRWAI
jgi:protein-S-isoprenylcysteine O-methyltransferase Ste14